MKDYISISDLESGSEKEPIFALNGSANSDLGVPGEVHIGIPKVNGSRIDNLHLPQTWLPICLTDRIPRPQLLASSEFRNAVNSRLLVLISKDFSEMLLKQEGADEERVRLVERGRQLRAATASRSIADSGAEIIATHDLLENTKVSVVGADEGEDLPSSFIMFANTLEAKTDVEAINLIRGRGRFVRAELNYLLKGLSNKPKTTSFIESRLNAPRKQKE